MCKDILKDSIYGKQKLLLSSITPWQKYVPIFAKCLQYFSSCNKFTFFFVIFSFLTKFFCWIRFVIQNDAVVKETDPFNPQVLKNKLKVCDKKNTGN